MVELELRGSQWEASLFIPEPSETRGIVELDWIGLLEMYISSQTSDLLFPRLHCLVDDQKKKKIWKVGMKVSGLQVHQAEKSFDKLADLILLSSL